MKLKRLSFAVILLCLLVGLSTGCQPQFQGGTFTDDMGRVVRIEKVPQRIVSHVPSITETIFALGLEARLVGVSDYCDYPEAAKLKPSVGNYFNPSIERIVALNPDLVLTDGHSEGIKELDKLGVNFIVIDPKGIDDIYRDIELLGKTTGSEQRAKQVIEDMQDTVLRVTNRVKGASKVQVFYLLDATDLNNPWTAGPGSFIDTLITMAGGKNVASNAQGAWVQFSIEQIVSADPEVIIVSSAHGTAITSLEALQEHPVWRETAALKEGKIRIINADLVDRTGPRIAQGLEEVTKAIHPELFG